MSGLQISGVTPKWQTLVWIGMGVALTTLLTSMLVFVATTQWRVLDVIQQQHVDRAFIASTLSSANLIVLRFVVVLMGGAIAFAGLAVSFFSHEYANVFDAGAAATHVPKLRLVSHSPGLIAVFVGAAVIVCALFAKTTTYYQGPVATPISSQNQGADNQFGVLAP
ncbi:hypothetical protein [Achromobacter sp.]|uniref:hypothetical protein n=1 Tax=Achromobacter sp. TaxID=134375 RepID=UPI0028AA5BB8|nr:hypothetical protein [Achromobacter sp.]